MVISRVFNGKLNYDSQPFRLPPADYLDALNISRDAEGGSQDAVISNIVGNRLVAYTLPGGINKSIGAFEDKTRNRIYDFIWNSNGFHIIRYYDRNSDTIINVLRNLTDTDGIDIIGADPSWRINHVDVIYDEVYGDLLFWTDGLNPPSKINVKTALAGDYGEIRRSYIDVAKEIPDIPPQVVFEDDTTVTVNNLRKKLHVFKYRYIFDDREKSATSAWSIMPIPLLYGVRDAEADPTLNADIAIVVQTGSPNVKKIEILGAQSLGNVFSDFFKIVVLDKKQLGIPDDDQYLFRFYNDKAYNYIDINESIEPFDFTPLTAFTQGLPNGNVLAYANIKEGYDNLKTLTSSNLISGQDDALQSQQPLIMPVTQDGKTIQGTENIHITVAGKVNAGDDFKIYTTNQTITYIAITDDDAADVIAGLLAAATADGFTIVSSDANNLVINLAGEVLERSTLTLVAAAYSITDPSYVYDWWSVYAFGLQYFDKKGRAIGGVQTIDSKAFTIETTGYAEIGGFVQLPQIIASIFHRAPPDAFYYHWVRTKNLSKSKFLQWVSDRTFRDTVASPDDFTYAYISIASLSEFILNNPATPLGYEFTPNDRIRFIKSFPRGGTTNSQIFDNKDFEIQSVVTNPIINGLEEEGLFIKIVLPTTDFTFDFGIQTNTPIEDPVDYSNYLIELYTPALSVANNLNVYYEFGERYAIGNPTLPTRFHEGQVQTQTADLLIPATFIFNDGDDYYRERKIYAGPTMKYTLTPVASGLHELDYVPMTLDDSFNAVGYIARSVDPGHLTGNLQDSDNWNINVFDGNAYSFSVTGTIIVRILSADPGAFAIRMYSVAVDGSGDIFELGANVGAATEDGLYVLNVNTVVNMAAGDIKLITLFITTDDDMDASIISGNLTMKQLDLTFTLGIIDPNFSDYYPSMVNSNGRPWAIEPDAMQSINPVLIRFSQAYQSGTNINGTNRFYEANFDEYDRSFGKVMKLFIEGRYLFVFQQFDIGVVPVLSQIIKDVTGNPLEANSDRLLNKIAYPYKGKIGIGDCPESFAYGKFAKYGVDNYKGVVWRLSQDGLTVLSVLYECNSFFVPRLDKYGKGQDTGQGAIGQPYTGNPTVHGVFNSYTNKYIIALEAINRYNSRCPAGYTLNEAGTACVKVLEIPATPPTNPGGAVKSFSPNYGDEGAYIMNPGFGQDGNGTQYAHLTTPVFWQNDAANNVDGKVNEIAIWATVPADGTPVGEEIGFARIITVAEAKTYYILMAGDNTYSVRLNGVAIVTDVEIISNPNIAENFHAGLIYPINLIAGANYIEMVATNLTSIDVPNPGAFAAEIYDNTKEEIAAATSNADLNIVFSTLYMVGQPFDIGVTVGWSCPPGWALKNNDGVYSCVQTLTTVPASVDNLLLHQDPATISFNESRQQDEGFESLLSYFPERMVCLNNLLVTYKSGAFWKHDSPTYCNFYGQQVGAFIKACFNDNVGIKKTFKAMTQHASPVWPCTAIETQLVTYGQIQQSVMIAQDFTELENEFDGALLRDSNSPGGLLNGDDLKGKYAIVKFEIAIADTFKFLNAVSIKAINSPLNVVR